MTTLDVIKLDYKWQETWRYTGRLLKRTSTFIELEAFFDRDDTPVDKLVLKRGDRYVEYYYTDRWYNVFEIRDPENHQIKGWYCNICYPAVFSPTSVAYRDLALDLLVYPNGHQVVLDETEFSALEITSQERIRARNALHELQRKFQEEQVILRGWEGL